MRSQPRRRRRSTLTFLFSFVVVSVLNSRQQTPVSKRTINPIYNPKDATFDFPLYLSTADKLGALELIVWDKDVLTKDYLGEAALPLEDWFVERPFAFDDPTNIVSWQFFLHHINTHERRSSRSLFLLSQHVPILLPWAQSISDLVSSHRPMHHQPNFHLLTSSKNSISDLDPPSYRRLRYVNPCFD